MPDITDWKQKYRDSLAEMQAEEDRWRNVEQVLRRLVGRLCAAGMGVDPQLDDELRALAEANRRNADAEELAHMAASLTSTVVAIDAVSPVLTSTPGTESPRANAQTSVLVRGALSSLLEQLPSEEDLLPGKLELLTAMSAARTDAELAALVGRAAEMISGYGDSLAKERTSAASVLGEVTRHLDDMTKYLRETGLANLRRADDEKSHHETVMWQVQELDSEAGNATDLSVLQSLVKARLLRVTREVCEFRAREEERLREYDVRAGHMAAHIAELERETRELHEKLDGEKHHARLDPLTGVANRKYFDERFALEIARRDRSAVPGALLLWDIDDFKLINDSYGHRAGDRVLQNVAGCFKGAARRGCDLAARIGGEEFILFLDGLTLSEALPIAESVRTAIASMRFHFRGTPVRVTASCGITELQSPDAAESAFERADSALYRAKRSGKNLCLAA